MLARSMRSRTITILVAVAAAAVTAAAAVVAYAPNRPSISFHSDVPDDVRRLAAGTWDRFIDAFPARHNCLQPVQLTVAWTYPDRADYVPDRKVVTLRVPGTATNLEATLAHELGHHLEFTCLRSHVPLSDLRPAFLAAQGFPPDAPWFEGDTWETTPSEQFAEAVAQVVTGHPPAHQRIVLTEAALDLLRTWGRYGAIRMQPYAWSHTYGYTAGPPSHADLTHST
jgi:hypothetical protein